MISPKKLSMSAIVVFLVLGYTGLPAATALRGLEPGDPAPDFNIRTIDGRMVGKSSLKGKVAILAFWRRDQEFSEKTLTDLERIYREYRDRGVTILAINADKAREPQIRRFKTDKNLSFTLSSDPELEMYGRFGVMVLPSTLIIDPGGKLANYHPIHTKKFYAQVRGDIRVVLGEISRARLEAELYPTKLQEVPAARKKANRHLNMGRMLMENKMNAKAREELEKAALADPTLVEPHILLARLYLENKNISKAITELEQALKLNPGSKEAKQLLETAKAAR